MHFEHLRRASRRTVLFLALGTVACLPSALLANDRAPVASSNIPVTAATTLKAGMRVQVLWQQKWWAAEILQIHPDGLVKLRYVGWGSDNDEAVTRDRLQLVASDTDTTVRSSDRDQAQKRSTIEDHFPLLTFLRSRSFESKLALTAEKTFTSAHKKVLKQLDRQAESSRADLIAALNRTQRAATKNGKLDDATKIRGAVQHLKDDKEAQNWEFLSEAANKAMEEYWQASATLSEETAAYDETELNTLVAGLRKAQEHAQRRTELEEAKRLRRSIEYLDALLSLSDDERMAASEIDIHGDFRTWTSASGTFKVKDTALVGLQRAENDLEIVVIRRRSGKTIHVALEKLAQADREYIDQHRTRRMKLKIASREVLPDPGKLTNFQGQVDVIRYFNVVGGSSGGRVWGTGIYTIDSSLSLAAIHAGVLKRGESAVVRVTFLGPQPAFQGSRRHNVTSRPYGAYQGSYKVERSEP